jgi:hypothetical protein
MCSRQRSLKEGSSVRGSTTGSSAAERAQGSLPCNAFSSGDPVLFMTHGKATDMHQRRRGTAASPVDVDASSWLQQYTTDAEMAQGVVVRVRREELVISFKIRPEFVCSLLVWFALL